MTASFRVTESTTPTLDGDTAASAAALEDMKASTRRLDAILQQLCARNASDGGCADESNNAAQTIENAPAWQDNAGFDSAAAFFDAVHRVLSATAVRLTWETLRRWNLLPDEATKPPIDSVATFTFLFPVSKSEDRGNQEESVMAETRRRAPLSGLSTRGLESQLVDSIGDVDHLAPPLVARAMARRMANLLALVASSHLGRAVAETLFPGASLSSSAVEWSEGSRIVKQLYHAKGDSAVQQALGDAIETTLYQEPAPTTSAAVPLSAEPVEPDEVLGTEPRHRLPEVLRVFHRLPRNRIVQAACARTHALLLSDTGLVFSFGQATDGALGHGDVKLSVDLEPPVPRLIEWFVTEKVVIESVACGGDDLTGAHSAAVSVDGDVFTWGGGVAFLLGAPLSRSLPDRVPFPRRENLHSDSEAERDDSGTTKIASIACGSGFSIAIDRTGRAFAWGKWSDGRLGLGPIPVVSQQRRRHGGRRQLQRFLLRPQELEVPGVQWRKISCGDAHCVAISTRGELFTWGRGSQGQLGLGSLADAMTPVRLMPDRQWRDVAAGSDFSLAVDVSGETWSWGGCGGAVLGLPASDDSDRHAIVADVLIQRHRQLRQQAAVADSAAVGFADVSSIDKTPSPSAETPPFRWLRPQRLTTLAANGKIRCVSAGVRHAAAISEIGELFLWGSASTSRTRSQGENADELNVAPLPSLVTQPRVFVDSVAERVFCGGDQVVALTSESFLARAIQSLLTATAAASVDSYLDTAADLVLLVDGRALWAHKLLLARRSRVLRELILNEERAIERTGDGNQADQGGAAVTELLLPGLRLDVARIVLEFLYTDNLTTPAALDPQSFLLRDVLRAAQRFAIPRLERLCTARLSAGVAPLLPLERDDSEDEDGDEGAETAHADSLKHDLAFAFGDETWSDLTLVAERRPIAVHRCVLMARSEYFRALLTFENRQQGDARPRSRRTLEIEHSYRSLWRVLHFIYNDALVAPTPQRREEEEGEEEEEEEDGDAPWEQLLEDLLAADKFGLGRMKRLCEHAIVVTKANCLDVLLVADLVHAAHLRHVALQYLQRHLSDVASADSSCFTRLCRECPHLLTELYERIREDTAAREELRSWQLSLERHRSAQEQAREAQWQAQVTGATFPWIPLIAALVFATLYLSFMHAREFDYPLVPAVNIVVLGGALAAALLGKL
ncbi:hypothetical protein P43SY_002854 [Pythium insidiosum]|uniref:BTB domain-containing protein n=1 Tax=Pythium insidiosum TaxID=114742 RepID=A0AAD5QAL3_PYTIN|nr:hypothetical protein P43SY_002854 [Pythium insidiosum]